MQVSRICLGCMGFGDAEHWVHKWVLNEEASRPFIRQALDLGINFFDTADMYSLGASEEILGRAIRDFVPREDVVLATKVFGSVGKGVNDRGASRGHIMDGVKASLKRLGTDYIDLYQIHGTDPVTPIEETVRALDDLVRDGLGGGIGHNFRRVGRLGLGHER